VYQNKRQLNLLTFLVLLLCISEWTTWGEHATPPDLIIIQVPAAQQAIPPVQLEKEREA